jgi:hypothetical protein
MSTDSFLRLWCALSNQEIPQTLAAVIFPNTKFISMKQSAPLAESPIKETEQCKNSHPCASINWAEEAARLNL